MTKPRFIPILTEVQPLDGYRLRLRYADGVEGEVDLSDLVGKGVFALWCDAEGFRKARIGRRGQLVWSKDVDISPDALYLRLTRSNPASYLHSRNITQSDAKS